MVSGSTEGGKQTEPSRKTALFCKVPLDFVWQLCFMVKYCQDTRKLSMQEKYGRSHQKASYPVQEPEESPKTHDGYRSPHGDMPRVYI